MQSDNPTAWTLDPKTLLLFNAYLKLLATREMRNGLIQNQEN
jgi:hypothetical protein